MKALPLLLYTQNRSNDIFLTWGSPHFLDNGLPFQAILCSIYAFTGSQNYNIRIRLLENCISGCPVTGLGEIDMSWTMGQQPLELSLLETKYKVLVDGKVLFLENVNEDSQGIYSCHSSNEAGNLTASLEIGIASKCIFPSCGYLPMSNLMGRLAWTVNTSVSFHGNRWWIRA